MARNFGEVAGYRVGSTFGGRPALHDSGVHRPPRGGISGSESEGADSIVVSGGYEDDEDYVDYIVYTGQGGNDPATGKQVVNQELTRR
ncbi:MAG: YDG/SRA domain-containing protein [Actinomycetota bacterium]